MLDGSRIAENLATDGMRAEMRLQPLAERGPGGWGKNTAVIHEADAVVPAFERNDPAPPAVTHEMVRRPRARGADGGGVSGMFRAQIEAVPILHAGEPRPDGVDRMLVERIEKTEFTREQRRATARVDDPLRIHRAHLAVLRDMQHIFPSAARLDASDLRRTPQFATGAHRKIKHVRIQVRAIDLKARQARIVARANLGAFLERLLRRFCEPHPQPLLGELMMAEIIRQAEERASGNTS